MDYQIYPLGITQIDWKRFISLSQDVLGFSPTRGLDASALPKHSDPAAFLSCVNFENNPQEALREGRRDGLFQHYFVNFIGIVEEEVILAFAEHTRVSVLKRKGHREYLAIFSATMDVWNDAVYTGCSPTKDWPFRISMNIIFDIFIKMGFTFPWIKVSLSDGTFTLQ